MLTRTCVIYSHSFLLMTLLNVFGVVLLIGCFSVAKAEEDVNQRLDQLEESFELQRQADARRIESLEQYIADLNQKDAQKKKKEAEKPTVKIGGRLHIDAAYFDQNEMGQLLGDAENASGIRRARMSVSGNYLEQINYKLEADFASNGTVAIKDAYAELVKLPLITGIRVGHFKESFSLDQLTSSNTIWFIERSGISNSLGSYAGERNLGIAIGNSSAKQDWLWSAGAYGIVADNNVKYQFDSPHGFGATARLARLFIADDENGNFLHLGGAYSYKDWDESGMAFSEKPEQGYAPTILKTDAIKGTDSYNACAAEFIWTYGSVGLQAEYYWMGLDNSSYSNPDVTGGYVQLGYWLTGEYYSYDRSRGALGRSKLISPFARRCEDGRFLCSTGAWQLAYRYSWADLSEIPGSLSGVMRDHTIGLNWYWGPHARVMFDYILSNTDFHYGGNADKEELINIAAMRLQVDY